MKLILMSTLLFIAFTGFTSDVEFNLPVGDLEESSYQAKDSDNTSTKNIFVSIDGKINGIRVSLYYMNGSSYVLVKDILQKIGYRLNNKQREYFDYFYYDKKIPVEVSPLIIYTNSSH